MIAKLVFADPVVKIAMREFYLDIPGGLIETVLDRFV